ncbi:hypothetical protein OG205_34610 [Lentzea sp. NBC_00516]|uniref:hypothetical protein n=1 Tax=Lentzea sp. NBC_00516 TaxID=2903582 RepID=UPI002E816875|nr:hypothetical protein [Lentzea sp. NBC_00516]WUD23163.1 hypothetical protein OG205_34610 [Lentzea sp. NBC_00516]
MIIHAFAEIQALADACAPLAASAISGWTVDEWHLDDDQVQLLADAYLAVLRGDIDNAVEDELKRLGVPIDKLLIADHDSRELVTRSDAIEIAAIAALIKADRWPTDTLYAPNVPKMSRKKSDSGIDAMAAYLDPNARPGTPLSPDEKLYICSVKHTLQSSSSTLRYDLVKSVSEDELTPTYLAGQLRVLKGHLDQLGVSNTSRVILFINQFLQNENVRVHAVAAVDPSLLSDLTDQLTKHLPQMKTGNHALRAIIIPDLANLHNRCAS